MFPALSALDFIRHGFTLRVPDLDVQTDRESALQRLAQSHAAAVRESIGAEFRLITAEQVHGAEVEIVEEGGASFYPAADGLITRLNNVCLGIYVADCCAVYIADPVQRAVALLHSGKKGTELGIATIAIDAMRAAFGSKPADLVVQLSPCIRPPLYETDFAAQILAQVRAAGVRHVFDCGSNTGADMERYYSYRVERGRTGRMLALIARAF
ncbi:MAG: purine-nucleoside/S-methyl-5-thioadenosine phosphorylase / adenosine deaminase [Chthoniobacter sp.]|jgi:copper oxidase (laccase) domain-containing protein|nr:purine-nucleoside/S-methyl-5-thioadenosine phosphorylase / adenosine deaminase [Chthoniobacter sp.]